MLYADNVSFAYDGEGSSRPRAGRTIGQAGLPFALSEVSVHVPRGGLVGILGPNGSGKSTLLKLLGGALRPAGGHVTLDGVEIASLPRRLLAARIASVPQETHLAFDYTVLEIVLMGRYPHLGPFALEGPRDLAIARDALAATETASLERRQFRTLSGGEKQRVVIASALAQSAEVLLLDEPTASLDVGFQLEIAATLDRLNRERGVTLVLSTHDLNLAAGLCRDLVLLRSGRVIASGATRSALTSESINRLYEVEADVHYHERAGRLTVIPIKRLGQRIDG